VNIITCYFQIFSRTYQMLPLSLVLSLSVPVCNRSCVGVNNMYVCMCMYVPILNIRQQNRDMGICRCIYREIERQRESRIHTHTHTHRHTHTHMQVRARAHRHTHANMQPTNEAFFIDVYRERKTQSERESGGGNVGNCKTLTHKHANTCTCTRKHATDT